MSRGVVARALRVKRLDAETIVRLICIVIVLFFVFAPVYIMIKFSMSDRTSLNLGGDVIPLWPNQWTFARYAYVLQDQAFKNVVFNRIAVAFLSLSLGGRVAGPLGVVEPARARRDGPWLACLCIRLRQPVMNASWVAGETPNTLGGRIGWATATWNTPPASQNVTVGARVHT